VSDPLSGFEFRFPNFKGLAASPGDWLSFGRTTLVVGRNNVGKSAIVDALRFAVDAKCAFNPAWNRNGGDPATYQIRQTLGEPELRRIFPESTSGGPINGQHWLYGQRFVGMQVIRQFDSRRTRSWLEGPNFGGLAGQKSQYLKNLADYAPAPSCQVFGVATERDVTPESAEGIKPVEADGTGLTNLVRAFLYDASLDMNEVEIHLLDDLNFIYQSDSHFTRILCQLEGDGRWEIYLTSDESGVVRLSQSGSSLKSVFIILATLRLNPIVSTDRGLERQVFFVEEPENNLHPALLRRLLAFLHDAATSFGFHLIMTTHSSAAIDWASRNPDASLYHVKRESDGVVVSLVQEYGTTRRLLDDLDIRASEILQANGVVWVEGPSDRTYINRWIELCSDGQLVEGQHYTVMFYGGKLLSHLSCAEPDHATEFIHLLRMNRNTALMMDSDHRKLPSGGFRSQLNKTKKRILEEAREANSYVWTTDGREIENYLSDRVVSLILGKSRKAPGKFESVSEVIDIEKIELARRATEAMEIEDLNYLDLSARVHALCEQIARWNGQ
jgi:putative ATP-dependent endonuclease of the OLD family